MRPLARSVFAIGTFAALSSACEPAFSELIVAVDAEDSIVAAIDSVTVEVGDGLTVLDHFEVELTRTKPACLPFSLGVTPEDGHQDLPLTVTVRARAGTGTIEKRIETRFLAGTHQLTVTLDRACLSVPCAPARVSDPPQVADRDLLISSMAAAACRTGISREQCIALQGCSTSSSAASSCETPCTLTELDPIAAPSPPVAVTPPDLDCAPGWTPGAAADTDGIALCEPWPAQTFFGCARGEARFPGESACAPIGASCPSGAFADALPATGVVFVDAGAAAGGDGSRATPYPTLHDALLGAPTAEVIALSKGTHLVDPLELDRPLTLRGACASATQLVREGASLGPLFTVTSSSVFLRDLAVRDADRALTIAGGVLHLGGVQVDGSAGSALVASGSSAIVLERVVLLDSGDTAIVLEAGAHASVAALDINLARGGGIRVSGTGSVLRMRDASVRAVSTGAGAVGFGVRVENSADAQLVRTVFENVEAHGVYAGGVATHLALEDVLVRDAAPAPDGTLGHGVHVQDSAQASLLRVGIERARHSALQVTRAGPVILSDLIVHDTLAQAANLEHGYAIACEACTLRGGRISIARATRNALDFDAASDIALDDIAVRDTRPDENDRSIGTGLVASRGTHVVLARALFERVRLAALLFQEDTIAELSDLVVRDTLAEESSATGGHGAFVKTGVRFEVERAVFERNRSSGITLLNGATTAANAKLEDLIIRDTAPSPAEVNSGRGLMIAWTGGEAGPIDVTLHRAVLADNTGAALAAERAVLDLSDLEVSGTRVNEGDLEDGQGVLLGDGVRVGGERLSMSGDAAACLDVAGRSSVVALAHARCLFSAGDGFVVRDGARFELRVFRVTDNAGAGVLIGEDAEVELKDGTLSGNAAGVRMSSSYDLARVSTRVVFDENGADIVRSGE